MISKKELNNRTKLYLIKLSKELGLNVSRYVTKKELILSLSRISLTKLNQAEEKLNNLKFIDSKQIEYKNKSYNRNKILISGLLLAFTAIVIYFILLKKQDVYRTKLSYNKDLYLVTDSIPLKENEFNPKSPLCGCSIEKTHYGISGFPEMIEITSFNNYHFAIEILANNEIAPLDYFIASTGQAVIVYPPFEMEFHLFKTNQDINFLNPRYYKNDIIKILQNSTKVEVKQEFKLDSVNNLKIMPLDFSKMVSIIPPISSKIKINSEFSNNQKTDLNYTIDISFEDQDTLSVLPKMDVLGKTIAYFYKKNDIQYILIGKSNFTQTVNFINKSGFNNILFKLYPVLSNDHYLKMIDSLELKRYEGIYYANEIKKEYSSTYNRIYMEPPFLKGLDNGIHFHGRLKKITTTSKHGEVYIESQKKILEYEQLLEIDIDTLLQVQSPIIFNGNESISPKNEMKFYGSVMIDGEKVVKSKLYLVFNKILNFVSIIIGVIGSFLTIVSQLGRFFLVKRKTIYIGK